MSNAANRKEIRAAEKRLARSIQINHEVITGLMSITNGRQWVWDRLEEANFFTSAFSPDALIHAYNSGQRVYATQLFNDIMLHCPDQFTIMMREAYERRTANERSAGTDTGGDDQGAADAADGPVSYPDGAEDSGAAEGPQGADRA